MDLNITLKVGTFDPAQHVAHIDDGLWLVMLDPDGNELNGIVGKKGVFGAAQDGEEIGADFIKMEPGAAFKPHTHVGVHVIYFMKGRGFVTMENERVDVRAGNVIYIPGSYVHAVGVPPDAEEPLVFVATGHPHKAVNSPERMQYPKESCR
jgi:quercetin dioxygenase-like cupin family protein